MSEGKRATLSKMDKIEHKPRANRKDSEESPDGQHAVEQVVQPVGETPFHPQMREHAGLLAATQSAKGRAGLVLRLQQTYGNSYVQRLVESVRVQAKLSVSSPGDIHEQEADRVAEAVTRAIDTRETKREEEGKYLLRQPEDDEEEETVQPKTVLQRQDDEEDVQMQYAGNQLSEVATALEDRINNARGSGQALPDGARAPMENAFGVDFSGVRVHTDPESDDLNRHLSAKAFTTGKDVFFRHGEYHPYSSDGRKLLAHELTHVVQQGGVGVRAEPQPVVASMPVNRRAEDEDAAPDWDAPMAPVPDERRGENDIEINQAERLSRTEGTTDVVQRVITTFPSWATMAGDGTVKTAADNAWKETKEAASPASRREQGFWVRWNSDTKAFSVTPTVVQAPVSAPLEGAGVTLGARPADAGDEYTVGSFHTHTPTRYRPVGRGVGPSGADKDCDDADNVAGLVYDYTAAKDGNIPARWFLNGQAKLYDSGGPNRRQ
ncbi:DUF4157 domain-containing protein [Chloroflexota bacterium]